MAFGLLHAGVRDPGELRSRVEGLREVLAGILDEARAAGETPVDAAARRVREVLARGRRDG